MFSVVQPRGATNMTPQIFDSFGCLFIFKDVALEGLILLFK